MNNKVAQSFTLFQQTWQHIAGARLSRDVDHGLTTRQAAQIWGCSYNEFRQLLRDGVIASYPVRPGSSHRRVTRRAIDEARARLSESALPTLPITSQSVVSDTDGETFLDSLFS